MLHLRILVPADLSQNVESLLRREPGVVHALAQLTINVIGLVSAGIGSLWLAQRLSRRRAIAEIQARRRLRYRRADRRDVS
jgi:hypothetical protein